VEVDVKAGGAIGGVGGGPGFDRRAEVEFVAAVEGNRVAFLVGGEEVKGADGGAFPLPGFGADREGLGLAAAGGQRQEWSQRGVAGKRSSVRTALEIVGGIGGDPPEGEVGEGEGQSIGDIGNVDGEVVAVAGVDAGAEEGSETRVGDSKASGFTAVGDQAVDREVDVEVGAEDVDGGAANHSVGRAAGEAPVGIAEVGDPFVEGLLGALGGGVGVADEAGRQLDVDVTRGASPPVPAANMRFLGEVELDGGAEGVRVGADLGVGAAVGVDRPLVGTVDAEGGWFGADRDGGVVGGGGGGAAAGNGGGVGEEGAFLNGRGDAERDADRLRRRAFIVREPGSVEEGGFDDGQSGGIVEAGDDAVFFGARGDGAVPDARLEAEGAAALVAEPVGGGGGDSGGEAVRDGDRCAVGGDVADVLDLQLEVAGTARGQGARGGLVGDAPGGRCSCGNGGRRPRYDKHQSDGGGKHECCASRSQRKGIRS
jgi:hypothetical protein